MLELVQVNIGLVVYSAVSQPILRQLSQHAVNWSCAVYVVVLYLIEWNFDVEVSFQGGLVNDCGLLDIDLDWLSDYRSLRLFRCFVDLACCWR